MIEGQVTNVVTRIDGSTLVSDVAAGATSFTVFDNIDFDEEAGGQFRIHDATNSEIKAYTVDPDGTIQFSALAHGYDANTRVDIYPQATERWAFLMEEVDQDQELEARIPHGLYSLFAPGIRRSGAGEMIEADWRGEDLVVVDKLFEEPVMDGSFIDPTTLPPATLSTDGNPPASSPAAVADGGVGFISVTWDPVANVDLVTYEIHLSTVSGFTPDGTTLSGEVVGGWGFIIAEEPDGTPLVDGTTYWVRIVARDADGSAAPGTEDSASIITIPTPGGTDGSAPASSPTPTVEGGPGYLFARWTPVANADPVTYEVHVSTVSGFAPGPGTKYGEGPGSSVVINKTAGGSALAYGTTYYVKLIAKDADGSAAAGAQGSGSLVQIANPDIANLAVGTAQIANLAVTDGKINTLSASKLTAGTIDASVISVTNLNASNITTGTIDASAIAVTNLNASNLTTGNVATARLTANVLAAVQANVANLAAITADLGTVTAGIFKTAAGVTWAGPAAGIIFSATDNGMRAFDGTGGTYELVGATGKVVVGALAADTTRQRVEISRSGMALYGGATRELSPPTTADLAWTTSQYAAIGTPQFGIIGVTNVLNPTITTTAAHGLVAGDAIEIRGVGGATGVNGFWTVASAPTGSTFTIATAAPGVYTAGTGAVWKTATIKGQFTTNPDTSGARMWFDYQGLHSQYQAAGINGNAPFRAFDFNPGDANGLRLHTTTTPDAIRLSPVNGITIKLAATNDPAQDLGARWVRQGSGALAAKVWGDNFGDDTLHGQINLYGYAANTGGIGQAIMQGQVGTGVTPARYARVTAVANVGTISSVTARAVYDANDSTSVKIMDSNGASDFAQLAKINAFVARADFQPATDTFAARFYRGTDTSPTSNIVNFVNAANNTILASVNPFGLGSFSGGITTKTTTGATTDANFGATPAAGTIAVDTTNNRLYVRMGAAWRYAPTIAAVQTYTNGAFTTTRAQLAVASATLANTSHVLATLIGDLRAWGIVA